MISFTTDLLLAAVQAETARERRRTARFALHQPVRYRVLDKRCRAQDGVGQLINMSSSGALVEVDAPLKPGRLLEVRVSWPGKQATEFVARARVVRCEGKRTALHFEHWEFCSGERTGEAPEPSQATH